MSDLKTGLAVIKYPPPVVNSEPGQAAPSLSGTGHP